MLSQRPVTDDEFNLFSQFIYNNTGIVLSSEKKTLVTARLSKRLRHYKLDTYESYFSLVENDHSNQEKQVLIDLLTTNETFFFREQKHFDFITKIAKEDNRLQEFSIWSAASSTGEEAYSLAMMMADIRGKKSWKIVGSDISSRVLDNAASGHYSTSRTEGIPNSFLKKYCLKGIGQYEGTLLIDEEIRSRVSFTQHNLLKPAANMGEFDVIFLRNVLIYFDEKTKQIVISHLIKQLKPGGYFIIGHSDKFDKTGFKLNIISPSIYQITT